MMDDSLADKWIILKAALHPMPMPAFTDEDGELFIATMLAELPSALHEIGHWKVPEELRSSRFGITDFHHPEIIDAIGNLAPETRLLDLIDSSLFPTGVESTSRQSKWEGGAEELEQLLRK